MKRPHKEREDTAKIQGPETPTAAQVGWSAAQRQTGMASILAFFRGNVGNACDPNFNKNFNPRNGLPSVVTSVTKVERGFMPSPDDFYNLTADDFGQSPGTDFCAAGSGNDCSGVAAIVGTESLLNHDANLHRALVNWLSSGPNTYYETNWAAAGDGTDGHDFLNLDFRVSRQSNLVDNPPGRTTFSIQLVLTNGLSNAVSLCKYKSGCEWIQNLQKRMRTVLARAAASMGTLFSCHRHSMAAEKSAEFGKVLIGGRFER